jgi:hypothetical protein
MRRERVENIEGETMGEIDVLKQGRRGNGS